MVKKTKKQNGGSNIPKVPKGNAGGEPPKKLSGWKKVKHSLRSIVNYGKKHGTYMSVENIKKPKDAGYMYAKQEDARYMTTNTNQGANYMVVDSSRNATYMTAEAANKPTKAVYINVAATIQPKPTEAVYITAAAANPPNSNFDANKYLLGKGSHDNTFGSRTQRFKKIQTDSLTNKDT